MKSMISAIYCFYLNRLKKEEDLSWWYTSIIISFILGLIFMSLIHLFLIYFENIAISKIIYMLLCSIPLIIAMKSIYGKSAEFKKKILLKEKHISAVNKYSVIVLIVLAKGLYWYTLALWAISDL